VCIPGPFSISLSLPLSLTPTSGLSASSSSPQGEGNCARRRSHASGGAMVDGQVRTNREREKERMEREVWRQEGGGGAKTGL
jgi:hypothetical protein